MIIQEIIRIEKLTFPKNEKKYEFYIKYINKYEYNVFLI